MALWRCPHCGTPQAETARCWVCRRSSTACGSCRHFRRSVAAQLGYCGLDRRRGALRGDEIRACWEAGSPVPAEDAAAAPATRPAQVARPDPDDRTSVRQREFIPVEPVAGPRRERRGASRTSPATTGDQTLPEAPIASQPADTRWSLWGDVEG